MTFDPLASIHKTLATEIAGLEAVSKAVMTDLSDELMKAVATMGETRGRIVVTGMGKSGHVGTKLAATLASTGSPAFFVHAAEASHGDLGMIGQGDVVLALSWSGETAELQNVLNHAVRFGNPLIAITSKAESTLARMADIALVLPKLDEACPHGLAPTSSTLAQMALGDALAVALLEARGFSAENFKTFHPGGKLGANLRRVSEIMHEGDARPLAASGTSMREALVLMTNKGFGTLGVTGSDGQLIGIITDGDLRRHLNDDLLSLTVDQVMTKNPKTIPPDALVAAVLEQVQSAKISAMFVVENGAPVGIVNLHDLLRVGAA